MTLRARIQRAEHRLPAVAPAVQEAPTLTPEEAAEVFESHARIVGDPAALAWAQELQAIMARGGADAPAAVPLWERLKERVVHPLPRGPVIPHASWGAV